MSVAAPVVWWILGAPCTGKSTAGEALARELPGTAYVDIDQLGMCYPEPEGDPGRELLKARAVGTLARRFVRDGAHRVLVSGVLADTELAVDQMGLPVVFCRLDVEPVELRRRLVERYEGEAVEQALREAEGLKGSAIAEVDGTGAEVAHRVRQVLQEAEPRPARPAPQEPASGGGRVVLLPRPHGAGRSDEAFGRFLELTATERTAYLDLDEISGHAALLWGHFWQAGATTLVVSGPVDDEDAFRAAFPRASVEVVRGLPDSSG